MSVDLRPATAALAGLVRGVTDDQLSAPTPCPDYTVGDLVEHVGGLAVAFRWAAEKHAVDTSEPPPPGDASRLEDGWRERIATDLDRLGDAWQEPAAWTGMTTVGGVDLPGEVAGLVGLDEVVLHGWDVARSTGQDFTPDADAVAACTAFLTPADDAPTPDAPPDGTLFGPAVPVPDDAPPLDRLVGLAGRDPGWSSPAAR